MTKRGRDEGESIADRVKRNRATGQFVATRRGTKRSHDSAVYSLGTERSAKRHKGRGPLGKAKLVSLTKRFSNGKVEHWHA